MIKDEFGREFLSLSNLSSLLNLSNKQTLRHVRDRNLLSKKFGKTRGVLKNDVIQTYPHLVDQIANVRDTLVSSSEEDVQFESRIGNVEDISVYQSDEKQAVIINKIESLGNIITAFEKRTENLRHIERDTLANHKILGRLDGRAVGIRNRAVWLDIVIIAAILGIIGVLTFGFLEFKKVYREARSTYQSQVTSHTKSIGDLSNKYDNLSKEYNQSIRQYEQTLGGKNVEIHQLNDQLSKYQEESGETL